MKKIKLIVQICLPIVIIGILISLYMIKNASDEPIDNSDLNIDKQEHVTPEIIDPFVGANFNLTVTSINIQELSKYGLPIIIDYGSEGCVPCQNMKPTLQKLNTQMYKKAFIKYIDVWENPDAADGLPIHLIPTQAFWNADGTPWVPSEKLQNIIGFDLYHDNTQGHKLTMHVGPLSETELMAILVEMGVDAYD